MKFIYTTPNQAWKIAEQNDLTGEISYSIYKKSVTEVFYPYTHIGASFRDALLWFRFRNIISMDEFKYALEQKNALDK